MAYTIGNRHHAKALWAWWNGGKPVGLLDPEVWKELGSGGQRHAYLHIATEVVYKLQYNDSWEDMGYCSSSELANARYLARKVRKNDYWWGAYVRIPRVSGFGMRKPSGQKAIIIGMQYVKGKHTEDGISREALAELRSTGLSDMHYRNTILDADGCLWPIDMGCEPITD